MSYPTALMPSANLSMPVSPKNNEGAGRAPQTEAGFGVYVHWPFCLSKCPYCDFNSHVVANVDQSKWAAAFKRELAHMRALSGPRNVGSIFFGGGTPSLMDVATVEAVLDETARLWSVDDDVEISLEANPTSVEATRFRGYKSAGVNRLSLGVQSLNDAALKFLGRLHTAQEALAAIALAREIFPRLSFDLIYARPGQSVAEWSGELKSALAHAVDHLSLYQLTIEEGTAFARLYEKGAFHLPEEDAAAELYGVTGEICAGAGLTPYEVSNYAAPQAECRHNLVYWRYGEYAGVGPGAHGRLVSGGKRLATSTLRAPGAWLDAVQTSGHGLDVTEDVASAEQGEEMMMMGLRLEEGVSLERYARLAGVPLARSRIDALAGEGLLECEGDRIAATAQGRLVLNGLLTRLLA